MIVEFCKYGNLSNYLRGKRDDFIVYKVSHELHDFLIILISRLFLRPYRKAPCVSAVAFHLISLNMIYVCRSEPGR